MFFTDLARNQVTDSKDEFLYDCIELLQNEKLLTAESQLLVAACAIRKSTGGDRKQREVIPSAWVKEYALRRNLKFIQLYPSDEQKCLLLGLDKAGKKTLCQRLKTDPIEEIAAKRLRYNLYDLSNGQMAREEWHKFCEEARAVVFMVDAADQVRLTLAKNELHSLSKDENLQGVPFLILGNKSDLPGALSHDMLIKKLEIDKVTPEEQTVIPDGQRALQLYMCSVRDGSGYTKGFQWLAKFIKS